MNSLNRILLIVQKENKLNFMSTQFFAIAGFFSLLMGWIFFNLLVTYIDSVHNHMVNQSNLTFSLGVLKPFFSNINFLLVIVTPIFTMKTLAGEKERGTFDLLMSSSLRPWELMIGKLIASWLGMFSLIVISFFIPLVLVASSLPLGEFLFSGYLAVILNMTLYTCVGVFLSSLSSNQNVAALMTLVGILGLWMIPWAAQTSHNLITIEIVQYLGVMTHFSKVLSGSIALSDIFYYLSFSALCISLSIFSLYNRRKYV